MKLRITPEFFTDIFYKLHDSKTRFTINYGSSGSSKSFSQYQLEIINTFRSNEKILMCRKVGADIKGSILDGIYKIINGWSDIIPNLRFYFNYHKSDRILTNLLTGSQIVFKGLDDIERFKSIEGITRCVIEEASEISEEDFKQLNLRLRGKLPAGKIFQYYLLFNPINVNHWIKKYFFDNPDRAKKTTIIHSTYRDNLKNLDTDYIEELEYLKKYDYNYYKIYALGQWGVTEVGKPFIWAFKEDQHVCDSFMPVDYLPIYLSFDINVDPITCTAHQFEPNWKWIRTFAEFKLENSNVFELSNAIKIKFAEQFNQYSGRIFRINGDISGQQKSVLVKDNMNFYKLLQKELNIPTSNFSILRNPLQKQSRVLTNTLFMKHPDIKITKDCPNTIDDFKYVETDEDGKIKKDRTKEYGKADLLDCERYFHWSNFRKFIKNYSKVA